MTLRLQYTLDFEPALEVMHVPSASGQQDGDLNDGPPLYTRVLDSVSMALVRLRLLTVDSAAAVTMSAA